VYSDTIHCIKNEELILWGSRDVPPIIEKGSCPNKPEDSIVLPLKHITPLLAFFTSTGEKCQKE